MGLKEQLIANKGQTVKEPEVQEEVQEEIQLPDPLTFDQDEQIEEEIELPDFNTVMEQETQTEFNPEPVITEQVQSDVITQNTSYDPEPVTIPQPQPTRVAYQQSELVTTMSTSTPDDLQGKLLILAKRTILTDIKDNFESKLLTSEAIATLITSYLEAKASKITNMNQVIYSFIDEVIDSGYANDYYKELTIDILKSIQSDVS